MEDIGRKIATLAQLHCEAAEIDANEATVQAGAYRARCRVAEAWKEALDSLQNGKALDAVTSRIITVSAAALAQLQTRIAVPPPIAPTLPDEQQG